MFKHRVAVYGTLKKGWSNHEHCIGSNGKYVGKTLVPGYVMLDEGGYPAAVKFDKRAHISVEIYDLNDEALASCDRLEGVDRGFYERTELVLPQFGTTFMYTQKREGEILKGERWIPSGIWDVMGRRQTVQWAGDKEELRILNDREVRERNQALKDLVEKRELRTPTNTPCPKDGKQYTWSWVLQEWTEASKLKEEEAKAPDTVKETASTPTLGLPPPPNKFDLEALGFVLKQAS